MTAGSADRYRYEFQKGRACGACSKPIKDKNVSGYCIEHFGRHLMRRVTFSCDECGHVGGRTLAEYRQAKFHFCSRRCQGKWQSRHRIGERGASFNNKEKLKSDEDRRLRVKARSDLNHAIRGGRVVREGCRVCGSERAEGHYPDYRKPLEVLWLCRRHHEELHHSDKKEDK